MTTLQDTRARTGLVLGGLALTAVLAACGSESDDPGTDPGTDPSSAPATSLTITMAGLNEGADEEPVTATLTCDPVGGDLESANLACQGLEGADGDPFASVADGQACLQVVEGPGEVTIEGTWDGTDVDAMFSQRDSCESERFAEVLALLGVQVPK